MCPTLSDRALFERRLRRGVLATLPAAAPAGIVDTSGRILNSGSIDRVSEIRLLEAQRGSFHRQDIYL